MVAESAFSTREKIAALDKEVYRLTNQKERHEEAIKSHIDYMWNEYELTYNMAVELKNEEYNKQVLGLTYNDDGSLQNPFESAPKESEPQQQAIKCFDGSLPDANGCCAGETYTDMGAMGWNCCPPEPNADCFPPIK